MLGRGRSRRGDAVRLPHVVGVRPGVRGPRSVACSRARRRAAIVVAKAIVVAARGCVWIIVLGFGVTRLWTPGMVRRAGRESVRNIVVAALLTIALQPVTGLLASVGRGYIAGLAWAVHDRHRPVLAVLGLGAAPVGGPGPFRPGLDPTPRSRPRASPRRSRGCRRPRARGRMVAPRRPHWRSGGNATNRNAGRCPGIRPAMVSRVSARALAVEPTFAPTTRTTIEIAQPTA
jgi:hypothetical protein